VVCLSGQPADVVCRLLISQSKDEHPFNSLFHNNLGKPAPERYTILDYNEARDDGMAVTSAGPYTYHLHFASDR